MIPPLDPETGNLPPGVHVVTWQELVDVFGGTPQRQWLLGGLRRAAEALRVAGCVWLYVDGSFATIKEDPEDFDGCWEGRGVNLDMLDPVLLEFSNGRIAQKIKYFGELFVARSVEVGTGRTFLQFFQHDKATGAPKGILALDLRRLSS